MKKRRRSGGPLSHLIPYIPTQLLLLCLLSLSRATVVFTEAECYSHLEGADLNRDNKLDRVEFTNAIKHLSRGSFDTPFSDFNGLPGEVRQAFEDLSCRCLGDGQDVSCCGGEDAAVDITGVVPGSPKNSKLREQLDEACHVLDVAINLAITDEKSVFVPAPVPVLRQGTPAPTPSQQQCNIQMFLTDNSPKDDLMNSAEYVGFVNKLSANAFGATFGSLPAVLQTNFNNLATANGQINIFGVRPGQNPSDAQTDFLERVCLETGVAINVALGVGTPVAPPPTTPPVPTPTGGGNTPRPTRPVNQCYVGMFTSDADRNTLLSQEEYASFVSFMEPGPFNGLTFDELALPLRVNFNNLANDGNINIAGLPRPDAVQAEFLDMVCDNTNAAISAALNLPAPPTTSQPVPTIPPALPPTPVPTPAPIEEPTAPPTLPPTAPPTPQPTPPPTAPPTPQPTPAPTNPPTITGEPTALSDEAEIVSQFVISNRVGITTAQLNQAGNSERQRLDRAYSMLAEQTVVRIHGRSNRYLRSQTNRQLEVNYGMGATRYYVDRAPCPVLAPFGSLCQEVVATFTIGISRDEDFDQVVTETRLAVDAAISAGDLQLLLTAEGSPLMVEEEAPVLNQPSAEPSRSPSVAPSRRPISGGFTGDITIRSAFVVSNTNGLDAAGLLQPNNPTTAALEEAYGNTGAGVVVSENDSRVNYVGSSETITDIVDTECPSNIPSSALCQAVFAEYRIVVEDDVEEVRRRQYTEATDDAIAVGTLQFGLDAVDPNSPLTIEEQATTPTRPPTPAPSPAPTGDSDKGGGGGLSTPVIIGIAAGGGLVLLLALGGGFEMSRRRAKAKQNQKVASSKPGFEDGLQDDNESQGYDESYDKAESNSAKGTEKTKSQFATLDDSEEPSSPGAKAKSAAVAAKGKDDDFARFEDSDSYESDSYASSYESESETEPVSRQKQKGTEGSQGGSDLDDYEFDDPTGNAGPKGKAAAYHSSSESGSEYSDSPQISGSSEESDEGWDDSDDKSSSGSESMEPSEVSESASQPSFAEETPPQKSAPTAAASRSAPVEDEGMSAGEAAGIGVAAGVVAGGGAALLSRKLEEDAMDSSSGVHDSPTEYTSGEDTGIDDEPSVASTIGDSKSPKRAAAAAGTAAGVAGGMAIAETIQESDSEKSSYSSRSRSSRSSRSRSSRSRSQSSRSGASGSRSGASRSGASRSEASRSEASRSEASRSSRSRSSAYSRSSMSRSRSGSSRSRSSGSRSRSHSSSGSRSRSSGSRSRSPGSRSSRSGSSRSRSSRSGSSRSRSSGSFSEHEESDFRESTPESERGASAPLAKSVDSVDSESGSDMEGVEPEPQSVQAKPAASGDQLRSALDDSDSDSAESEYTTSDNDTYVENEEGTLDDGTVGTYEGITDDGNPMDAEEAIAMAAAATERLARDDEDDSLKKPQEPPGMNAEEVRNSDLDKNGDDNSYSSRSGSYSGSDGSGSYSSGSYTGSSRSSRSSYSGDSRSRSGSSASGSYSSGSYSGSSRSGSKSRSGSESGSGSGSESAYTEDYTTEGDTEDYTTEGASSAVDTSVTETPAEIQRKQEVRAEVEALVRLVVPEEVDNIDAMLAQFKGREEELLQTLRTMQERSVTVRARAAVHKSKGRPPPRRPDGTPGYRRDGQYSVDSRQTGESETSRGSAAGSAAIAAASMPRPAQGRGVPIHAPPVPAYEKRQSSDGSSPYSDEPNAPAGAPGAHLRSTSMGSQGNLRSDGSSQSGSESSGSYTDGSYTSASGSYSGSESVSHSGSESYDSKSLDDLPSRWKTDKKKPWSPRSDDAYSQDTDEDRHQARSIGDSYKS